MHTYEPTPVPQSPYCKLLAWGMGAALWGAPVLLIVLGWWKFHWSVGLIGGVFGYLLSGVLGSKMRQLSIPQDQQEISFSAFEIARWYVVRYLCCDA